MTDQKQRYLQFAAENQDLPIFLQPWWLNVVCENQTWEVVLTGKEKIEGVLPYSSKKKSIFKGIGMPNANLFLGPCLFYPTQQKYTSRLSFEHRTLKALLKQLPQASFFEQVFDEKISNPLAFKWLNYQQNLTVSYQLSSIDKHDEIFANFKSTIRRDVRLAEKTVHITKNPKIDDLFQTIKMSYAKHQMDMPFSLPLLTKLYEAVLKKNQGKLFTAQDAAGNIHASALIVWDNHRAYCLFRGGNPVFLNSGAMSLLLWEAIKDSSNQVDIFDFGGSSIEPIEKFVRAFGGQQIHRYHISKSNSFLFYLAKMGRELLQFIQR